MDLYKQYCNRKQALKLKSLGVLNEIRVDDPKPQYLDDNGKLYKVPNVGIFYSVEINGKLLKNILGDQEDAPYEMYNPVKHYSVAELGIMLPNEIDLGSDRKAGKTIIPAGNYFFTKEGMVHKYTEVATRFNLCEYQGTRLEAEVRAEMLIDLIEFKFVTVEDVNARLLAQRTPPAPIPEKKKDTGGLSDFLKM